jgi:hypothetical protein
MDPPFLIGFANSKDSQNKPLTKLFNFYTTMI